MFALQILGLWFESSRACSVRNIESLKAAVRLLRFPCTATMTDERLIERISRRGQWERQKLEEATGESSWVSGRFRTAPWHLHKPQGETETGWERQTGDWETPVARLLTELRWMSCYVKHIFNAKVTHAHTCMRTHTFIIQRTPING